MNGRIQSYRQTVHKVTGKRGRRVCLMRNECLICDGTCAGYAETEERMRPLRQAHWRKRQEMRRKRTTER